MSTPASDTPLRANWGLLVADIILPQVRTITHHFTTILHCRWRSFERTWEPSCDVWSLSHTCDWRDMNRHRAIHSESLQHPGPTALHRAWIHKLGTVTLCTPVARGQKQSGNRGIYFRRGTSGSCRCHESAHAKSTDGSSGRTRNNCESCTWDSTRRQHRQLFAKPVTLTMLNMTSLSSSSFV